jgi:putative iron-dependent peroxidase
MDTEQAVADAAPGLVEPQPQPVLGGLTTAAVFLVVSARGGPDADRRVLEVASDVGSLVRAVGFRASEAGLTCVVGFGSSYWDRVRPPGSPRPIGLHPFRAVHGARHAAPSTPGDVLFHIRANRDDLTFELARQLMDALRDDVEVEDHVTGFRYFDSRDLLGFVDGTENPTGRDVATAALITADVEPDFAAGSYVVVQKYLHDLQAWNALSVEEQEQIIGRTKLDDIELPDDVRPTNSHVTLNTIVDENGEERDILRNNMVFGDAATGEYGTYYIANAADVTVVETMLDRMFLGEPPGNYDRILDVSTAVTGSLFFVPSLDLLEALADEAPRAPGQPADLPSDRPTRDDSLTIARLRGVSQ